MNKQIEFVVCFLGTVFAVAQATGEVFDGGWRLSAGAVYDSGVRTQMKFMPQQTYSTPYTYTPGATVGKEKAEKLMKGETKDGRTTFTDSSGNKSWHGTTAENQGRGGHDDNCTRNYQFSQKQWNEADQSFTFVNGTWEHIESKQESFVSQEHSDKDERAMPGVNLQLSRNLYHNDDDNWGLEVAVAVQYARHNKAAKSGSSWKIGSSTKKSGTYAKTYNASGDLGDALTSELTKQWFWKTSDAGEVVAGQPSTTSEDWAVPVELVDLEDDGVADLKDAKDDWGDVETSEDADFGSLYAKGDYDNLEMMLLLQPYYDVCDWFSVNATLGVVCSRQSMDMTVSMFRNGQREYYSDREYDQWDVYGIAGLGLMFYYDGWTLSGDFLARFLDRDLEINDRCYKGKVTRGNWMFRLGLGYEF